jgi:hypothetical protein
MPQTPLCPGQPRLACGAQPWIPGPRFPLGPAGGRTRAPGIRWKGCVSPRPENAPATKRNAVMRCRGFGRIPTGYRTDTPQGCIRSRFMARNVEVRREHPHWRFPRGVSCSLLLRAAAIAACIGAMPALAQTPDTRAATLQGDQATAARTGYWDYAMRYHHRHWRHHHHHRHHFRHHHHHSHHHYR